MEVVLSVDGEDSAAGLEELEDWLRHEPELRRDITAVPSTPRPGELGTVTDLLSVALASGGALSVLAAALKSFFEQPRRSDITIKIRTADGRSISVDARRADDIQALLRDVLDESK